MDHPPRPLPLDEGATLWPRPQVQSCARQPQAIPAVLDCPGYVWATVMPVCMSILSVSRLSLDRSTMSHNSGCHSRRTSSGCRYACSLEPSLSCLLHWEPKAKLNLGGGRKVQGSSMYDLLHQPCAHLQICVMVSCVVCRRLRALMKKISS